MNLSLEVSNRLLTVGIDGHDGVPLNRDTR